MKKFILFLGALTFFSQAHAGNKDNYDLVRNGTLVLSRALEITNKDSSRIEIPAGTYRAFAGTGQAGGFLGIGSYEVFYLDVREQTGDVAVTLKIELTPSGYNFKNQSFSLTSELKQTKKVTSAPITEEESCTLETFTTQENCTTVYDRVCTGMVSIDSERTCVGGTYVSVPKLSCDSVTHRIPGRQTVTYQKATSTVQQVLYLIDRQSNQVIGQLFDPVSVDVNDRKIISQTQCR